MALIAPAQLGNDDTTIHPVEITNVPFGQPEVSQDRWQIPDDLHKTHKGQVAVVPRDQLTAPASI